MYPKQKTPQKLSNYFQNLPVVSNISSKVFCALLHDFGFLKIQFLCNQKQILCTPVGMCANYEDHWYSVSFKSFPSSVVFKTSFKIWLIPFLFLIRNSGISSVNTNMNIVHSYMSFVHPQKKFNKFCALREDHCLK